MWEERLFKADLLRGARILVTGGGTGLGKAMAERFLSLGGEVFICGRRKGVCDATAAELTAKYGGKVSAYGVDIRDFRAVDEMVEAIFAGGPLTGLVNNAAGNFISRTEDLTPGGFNAIADIVMRGSFYVTHAVGKRWIASGVPGAVVSIVVTWVRNGGPFVVPSAMSKAAVSVMTKSLAVEWGRYGIRLNAIAPGEIPTEGMSKRLNPGETPGDRTAGVNPMGRVGTHEELQNLAVFLLSDGCRWLTGETIALDGGQSLATGGTFYQTLRNWSAEDWRKAREAIKEQNEKDRGQRTTDAAAS
jgi:NAD(P)-dependent dehydrogenase (short-subunit alcohol dehydrogenase family)